MQYLVKFFNLEKGHFVGYYKETGIGCISKMLNGSKYFNSEEEALSILQEYNGAFLRDKDHHYYTSYCTIYGDNTREFKEYKKSSKEKKEELKDELETFIRQNRRQTGRTSEY